MSQSLANIVVHLVFSTKYRQPVIMDGIRGELHAYIIGILRKYDCCSIIINSELDHVHILFSLSKNQALSKIVEEIKRGSSKWLKTKDAKYANFYWQGGYGAFSVSQSQIETVTFYIANQREHHENTSFQDEMRALFVHNGITFDERHLWD
ncbi:MAG: IS200/IS605 family transposase [bacterium]